MSKLVLIPSNKLLTAAAVSVAVELNEPYNLTPGGRGETTKKVCKILGAVDFIERNGILEAFWPQHWFQINETKSENIN